MKETLNNLKKVLQVGIGKNKKLIFILIRTIIMVVAGIITPIYIAKRTVSFTGGLWEQTLIVSLFVFGIMIARTIISHSIGMSFQSYFNHIYKNLQIYLAKKIIKLEVSEIDKTANGTFVRRMTADTERLSGIFNVVNRYLTEIIIDIGVFVSIFIINKIVFVYYAIFFIILVAIHLTRARIYSNNDKLYRKQQDKVSGFIAEFIRGIRDIKMLNAEKSFMNEMESNVSDLTNKSYDMKITDLRFSLVVFILRNVCSLFLIFLIIYLIQSGELTIALGIVLMQYGSYITDSLVSNIGQSIDATKDFNLSCNRIFSLLDGTEFGIEKFGNKHINKIDGNITFENVTFGYNEDNIVLKELSFKIKAGETIAFVGKSGAGKSTIFNLICKLYNINNGKITIEDIDINALDESSIRGNITIISQNPYIFNLSIKDNLRLVKEDLTDDEMINACKLTCLDDYIKTLPNGYDTIVGEGGVILSGGQKQRLAIARAFVQKTKIILFDEATSALDNETQYQIQQTIDNLKKDYTILIIAHRLSTIMNADKIMVLNDGNIEAIGNHKGLLNESKIYKKLYETELIENDKL